jgi:hypothetical protein
VVPLSVKRKAVDLVHLINRANEEMALVERDVKRVMDSYKSYGTAIQTAVDGSTSAGVTCLLLRRRDFLSLLKRELYDLFPTVLEQSQSGRAMEESVQNAETTVDNVTVNWSCNSELDSDSVSSFSDVECDSQHDE